MQNANKPIIKTSELAKLEALSKNIKAMKEGPAKERYKEALQLVFNEQVQKYDIPPQVIAPDAALLKLVDYPSGIVRTTVGELARVGRYATDPTYNYNPSSAVENIKNSVNPLVINPFTGEGSQPAKASDYYLEEMGLDRGKQLSNTDFGRAVGITPSSLLDVSPRGVAGFALDVASGNALKGLAPSAEREALKETAGMTAKQVRKRQQEFLDAMNRKMAPGLSGTVMGGVSGAPGFAADPLQKLGELLYKSRFSNADAAALKAGKVPVSDVLRNANAKGATSAGILQDMESIATRRQDEIQDILNKYNNVIDKSSQSSIEILKPIYSREMAEALANPMTADAALETIKEVEEKFRKSIRQNPKAPDWMQSEDPTFVRASKMQGQNTIGSPSTPSIIDIEDQPTLPGMGMYPPKSTSNIPKPGTRQGFIDIAEGSRPTELLDAAYPFYDAKQLNQLKKDFQKEAYTRGMFRPTNLADQMKAGEMEFGAKTYRDLGARAGKILEKNLDKLEGGLGGKMARANQEIASILEAAPYIDKAPKGVPAGSRAWRMGLAGGLGGAVSDTIDALKVPVGRGLMSPVTRYGIAPAARSLWLEDYWNRQLKSPYGTLYRYGGPEE